MLICLRFTVIHVDFRWFLLIFRAAHLVFKPHVTIRKLNWFEIYFPSMFLRIYVKCRRFTEIFIDFRWFFIWRHWRMFFRTYSDLQLYIPRFILIFIDLQKFLLIFTSIDFTLTYEQVSADFLFFDNFVLIFIDCCWFNLTLSGFSDGYAQELTLIFFDFSLILVDFWRIWTSCSFCYFGLTYTYVSRNLPWFWLILMSLVDLCWFSLICVTSVFC